LNLIFLKRLEQNRDLIIMECLLKVICDSFNSNDTITIPMTFSDPLLPQTTPYGKFRITFSVC